MTDVTIVKSAVEDFGTETFTITIDNIKEFRIITSSPVLVLPIPENSAENTIVIKVEGNIQRVTVSFTIFPRDSGDDLVTGGDLATAIDTSTTEGQIGFLTNEFQPEGIRDNYTIELTNPTQGFKKICNMEELDISLTEGSPVTYLCKMQFAIGDVQTVIDEDVPQEAPTTFAVADVAGDPQLTWANVATADQGGSAISGYQVQRRAQTEDWVEIAASASTPYNDTSASK